MCVSGWSTLYVLERDFSFAPSVREDDIGRDVSALKEVQRDFCGIKEPHGPDFEVI